MQGVGGRIKQRRIVVVTKGIEPGVTYNIEDVDVDRKIWKGFGISRKHAIWHMLTDNEKRLLEITYSFDGDRSIIWDGGDTRIQVHFTDIQALVQQSSIHGNVIDAYCAMIVEMQKKANILSKSGEMVYMYSSVCADMMRNASSLSRTRFWEVGFRPRLNVLHAISYGENGSIFCGRKPDRTHLVDFYGSNSAIIFATPFHFPFVGLTGGNGFVCGLLKVLNQPYCWGSSAFIQMGVPQPMVNGSEYSEISTRDHHLCGLRKRFIGKLRNAITNTSTTSIVDCWGYNMTANHVFDDGPVKSISVGSEFNCGLFSQNSSVFCWGDETSNRVISLIPKQMRFQEK
ncbi:Serine/threonine-protein kinase-like protein ACR4 [Camellia lanceoleosa]|uniref:Serine/threonine-protein kinase-like protein ACR4 n=1 Tax=Camellia lanceoleosa TaxID=1840588 RepID=A0ACC0GA92_9ERIC|nr:Serine/threonine-protein kinase-like protein ACR4 [Camellia lanceoleosa]